MALVNQVLGFAQIASGVVRCDLALARVGEAFAEARAGGDLVVESTRGVGSTFTLTPLRA